MPRCEFIMPQACHRLSPLVAACHRGALKAAREGVPRSVSPRDTTRPAPRLRSKSEAGYAASVQSRKRLKGCCEVTSRTIRRLLSPAKEAPLSQRSPWSGVRIPPATGQPLPISEPILFQVDSILTQTCQDFEPWLDPVTSSAGCRGRGRTSAGWRVGPGDEGCDKFGRLPGHERGPCQARKTEHPVKNKVFGNLVVFAHFFGPKESGDEAVTSGDKLSGMELASLSGQKPEIEQRLEPVFDRNRANLEAEAPRLPSDRKKQAFREFGKFAVLRIFSTKNGAVTKTGDIGKTFSRMENVAVLQGFSTQKRKLIGYYRPMFLATICTTSVWTLRFTHR